MKDLVLSVGFKKKGDYKKLTKITCLVDRKNFDEFLDKENYPHLYTKTGNRRAEHVTIYNKETIKCILNMRQIKVDLIDCEDMGISLMWCDNIVSLSITLFYKDNKPQTIYVSSFISNFKEQETANKIIDYINLIA